MARVSDVDIIQLVDIDSDIDLDPFILVANELVTELCTDSSYSDVRLKAIEQWLTCHMYQMRDQLVKSETAGPVSVTYASQIGLGLNQTKYGQTAMLLDTSGNLAALSRQTEEGQPSAPTMFWMGDDYTTSTDDPD